MLSILLQQYFFLDSIVELCPSFFCQVSLHMLYNVFSYKSILSFSYDSFDSSCSKLCQDINLCQPIVWRNNTRLPWSREVGIRSS